MSPADAAPEVHERALAVRLFNEVWTLLQHEERSDADSDRMVHMAHASRFHWDAVGGAKEKAIGEWQVSRVYATLGRGEPAVHHARRCVELAGADGVEGWVAATAHEGLARALLAAGEPEAARDARDRAVELLAAVEDEDDRAVVQADLDALALP